MPPNSTEALIEKALMTITAVSEYPVLDAGVRTDREVAEFLTSLAEEECRDFQRQEDYTAGVIMGFAWSLGMEAEDLCRLAALRVAAQIEEEENSYRQPTRSRSRAPKAQVLKRRGLF